MAVSTALNELGVEVSPSHYRNLEAGRYEFRLELLSALRTLFPLPSEVAELVRGQKSQVPSAKLEQWRQWAAELVSANAGEGLLAAERDSLPDSRVSFDPREIVDMTIAALTGLADTPAEHARTSDRVIQVVGFPGVVPQAGGDGWSEVRAALIAAMRAGYHCRHILSPRGDTSEASLLRMSGSLVACKSYRASIIDSALTGSSDLLLVPASTDNSGVAIQYYLEPGTSRVASAVRSVDSGILSALRQHTQGLFADSRPLVDEHDRGELHDRIDPSPLELAYHQRLTERAGVGAWAAYCLGWFPNAVVSQRAFALRVAARQTLTSKTPAWYWAELTQLHEQRRQFFQRSLRSGQRMEILLTSDRLRAFVEKGTHHRAVRPAASWRDESIEDRRDLCLAVSHWLRTFPNLQVRVANNERHLRGARVSKWEIRGGPEGFVSLQTPYRDGTDLEAGAADILMRSQLAVSGFKMLFDDLFEGADLTTADTWTDLARQVV